LVSDWVRLISTDARGAMDARALDRALADHGLIKVRFTDHKSERKQLAGDLAARTSSRKILQVGHTVTLYRTPLDKSRRV
jgi:RNA-binding protein